MSDDEEKQEGTWVKYAWVALETVSIIVAVALLVASCVERRLFQSASILLHRSCPPGQTNQFLWVLCLQCPRDTMKPTPGSGRCIKCPEGSMAEKGQAWCECLPGFSPSNLNWHEEGSHGMFACAHCRPGTYKPASGNVACIKCASGFTSTKGSIGPESCIPWVSTLLQCASGDCSKVGTLYNSASDSVNQAVKVGQSMAGSVLQDTSEALEGAATVVVDFTLDSLAYMFETMDVVTDLFRSNADFLEELKKKPPPQLSGMGGGHGRENSELGSRFLIRCETPEDFLTWYQKSVLWREFDTFAKAVERRSGGRSACKRMKQSAKGILLNFHPDKVAVHHPQCPPDATLPAIMELNRRYASLKTLCKASGDL